MKIGDRVRVVKKPDHIYGANSFNIVGAVGEVCKDNGATGGPDWCYVKFVEKYGSYHIWGIKYTDLQLLDSGVAVETNQERSTPFKVGETVIVAADGEGAYYMSARNQTAGKLAIIEEVLYDSINVKVPDGSTWWVNKALLRYPTGTTPTTTESTKTMVYRVTVIAVPSAQAQQNGAIESVLVDNETFVAASQGGAAFLAGQANATVVTKGLTLKTIVNEVSGGY